MDAGRELDALVAEKVMGWSKRISADHSNSPIKQLRAFGIIYAWKDSEGNDRGLDVWHYSTDIAAAWQVVEKMKALEWRTEIAQTIQSGVDVTVIKWEGGEFGGEFAEWGETAPHAICLAALKAIGE
jgi:hypothetical protein